MSFLHRIFGAPHSLRRIYGFSTLATLAALIAVAAGLGPFALFTVAILIALEVTFSFDNAVVNAKVLARMPAFWRRMFMTVGIFIAVFGMRLVLPIVLVAVTAGLGVGDVINLALQDPAAYAAQLTQSHAVIAAFGGMFLLMIFIEFMLDDRREIHWLHLLERPLARVGQLSQFMTVIALTVLLIVTQVLGGHHKYDVLLAGVAGILTYLAIHALARIFERQQQQKGVAHPADHHRNLMRAGFFNFIYLEVLDASFSFDGVIGAFAITQSVVLIAAGLGVGAVWVRSMTVHMVRRHTLSKYRYLDHGAHYAIGALATMLLLSIAIEIPEYITGTIGIGIIGAAFTASWLHNRRQARVRSLAG